MLIWLRRFNTTRGYGVQSPFVFNFLREVIGNKSAYYVYQDLASELNTLSTGEKKRAKLAFRLANFAQPSTILISEQATYLDVWLRSGCRRAKLITYRDIEDCLPTEGPTMLVSVDAEHIPSDLPDGSLVFILNAPNLKEGRGAWNNLVAQPWATLTFDLHDSGLILVCPTRHKEHFAINF